MAYKAYKELKEAADLIGVTHGELVDLYKRVSGKEYSRGYFSRLLLGDKRMGRNMAKNIKHSLEIAIKERKSNIVYAEHLLKR